MQAPQPGDGAGRATRGLAVDGQVLARQSLVPGGHPTGEATLEGRRVQPAKDPFVGVVRRQALGQVEELGQPVATLGGEQGNLLEVGRARDDGVDGDDEDRLQGVGRATDNARVFQRAEMAKQGKRHGHGRPP